jgi:hypothetical protein
MAHLASLLRSGEVDHMMFNCLPKSHALWGDLTSRQSALGKPVVRDILHWETRLLDVETGERQHHNSSRTRATWRRKDRKLTKAFEGELEMRCIRSPEDVAGFLKDADSVTMQAYHGAIGAGLRDSEIWRLVVGAMADSGHLRSYLLTGKGEPLAYVLGAVYKDVFTLEATSFAPKYSQLSPGTVLMVRLFDDLAEAGVPICDFGFGDAEYKRLNGTNSWQESSLDIYGRPLRARVAHRIDATAQWLTLHGKRLANATGRAGEIRKAWRRRLEGGGDSGR